MPKDTKQLVANYNVGEQCLFSAVVASNRLRKELIASDLVSRYPEGVIGIYGLAMKAGSDNFRESAILEVIGILKKLGREVIIYEPLLDVPEILECEVVEDYAEFESRSVCLVCNRLPENDVVRGKNIYTRDVFGYS